MGITLALVAFLWAVRFETGAAVMFCVACFVAFFFRNPERRAPSGDGIIVAPADGRVIEVKSGIQAPFTGDEATRISTFMSILDVHINRFPVSARLKKVIYNTGKFLVASRRQASLSNESNTLVFEDELGRQCVLVQIAGFIARRLVCYVREGDFCPRGERLGLIRFGSRVDLYLPRGVSVTVKRGERVRAGESVVGRFV